MTTGQSTPDPLPYDVARSQGQDHVWRALQSAGEVAIIVFDPVGRVTIWNTGAENLFGWSAEEILGRSADIIFTEEDRASEAPERERQTAREKGGASDDRWHQRKDGSRFFASGKVTPIRDERGELVGFTKVCRDLTDKVRQRMMLEESEARYRLLVELSPQLVWFAEADKGVTFFNQRWFDLTGLTMEQSGGDGWMQAIPVNHRERIVRRWHEITRGNADFEMEVPFRSRDGSIRWHLARGTPMRDENGRIVRWIGVALDIHDRKKAQAAQAPFRVLFESAPGLYLVLAPDDFRIVAASDAYLRATMTERKEIMRRSLFEIFPDPPNEPSAMGVHNLRASLERVKSEKRADVMAVQYYPVRRPEDEGGGWEDRWWSPVNSPVLGSDGELLYIIHRVEDVTPFIQEKRRQGKEAEGMKMLETRAAHMEAEILLRGAELQRLNEQLRASEEEHRVMFEVASAGLVQADAENGRFLRVNDRLCQITGYTKEELLTMHFPQLTHPEEREEDLRIYERAKEGGAPFYINEKRLVRKDGSFVWVRISAAFIRNTEGRALRTFAVIEDVTSQKETEHALQEADRRKTEFLAMLAHELRNPLAAIRNATQVSREDASDATFNWALDVIERQGGQLTQLVDDLLDVSRITRGLIRLRPQMVDAAVILEHAVESVRPLLARRRHELILSYDSSGSAFPLKADPARVEQIVTNLLTNAAKYTPDGGRIELGAWTEQLESLDKGLGHVVIRVRDNGIGIPPERQEEMFELFAQGERGLARSEGGLGIGLAIVRKLTEMHGGTVSVFSKGAGLGSEFVVRLPLAKTSADAAAARTPPLDTRGETPAAQRVLVVDDNADTAEGLARLLRRRGFTVAVANDGPGGVAKARDTRPHFILLDIGLPGMDGFEVAKRLRGDPCCRGATLIAISGYGQEEDRRRSREAGFDHHLTKPVNIDDLQQLLANPKRRDEVTED